MNPLLSAPAEIFRLNDSLLLNCLDGMDDEGAQRCLAPETNHAAFLALHLVDARCFLLGMLGQEIEHPFGDRYEAAKGIADIGEFPSLDELREAWSRVGVRLMEAIAEADEERLAATPAVRFPVEDPTVAGGVLFLAQHETYHIGQLALLRKALGLGAMSYE